MPPRAEREPSASSKEHVGATYLPSSILAAANQLQRSIDGVSSNQADITFKKLSVSCSVGLDAAVKPHSVCKRDRNQSPGLGVAAFTNTYSPNRVVWVIVYVCRSFKSQSCVTAEKTSARRHVRTRLNQILHGDRLVVYAHVCGHTSLSARNIP